MGSNYRAQLENWVVVGGEQLYLIEKKDWLGWSFLTYKYGKTPLDAIDKAKLEEAQMKEDKRWHYGG